MKGYVYANMWRQLARINYFTVTEKLIRQLEFGEWNNLLGPCGGHTVKGTAEIPNTILKLIYTIIEQYSRVCWETCAATDDCDNGQMRGFMCSVVHAFLHYEDFKNKDSTCKKMADMSFAEKAFNKTKAHMQNNAFSETEVIETFSRYIADNVFNCAEKFMNEKFS